MFDSTSHCHNFLIKFQIVERFCEKDLTFDDILCRVR
jgi:hypothetical protein